MEERGTFLSEIRTFDTSNMLAHARNYGLKRTPLGDLDTLSILGSVEDYIQMESIIFGRQENRTSTNMPRPSFSKRMSTSHSTRISVGAPHKEEFHEPIKAKDEAEISMNCLRFHTNVTKPQTLFLCLTNNTDETLRFEFKPNSCNRLGKFHFYDKIGILAPHSTHSIGVCFKSNDPGIYKEIWTLETFPQQLSNDTIVFQGFSIQEDVYASSRKELSDYLNRQKFQSFVKSVVLDIVSKIPSEKQIQVPDHVQETMKCAQYKDAFMKANEHLQVYWDDEQVVVLKALAKNVYHHLLTEGKHYLWPVYGWNFSMEILYDIICQLDDAEFIKQSLQEWHRLLQAMRMKKKDDFWKKRQVARVLTELAESVVESSFKIRAGLRLPVERVPFNRPLGEPLGKEVSSASTRKGGEDDKKKDAKAKKTDKPDPKASVAAPPVEQKRPPSRDTWTKDRKDKERYYKSYVIRQLLQNQSRWAKDVSNVLHS